MNSVPWPRSVALLFLLLFVVAFDASAQSTLIALSTRRDMVFDHSGNYLYVSTSDGFVRRYNLATAQFDLSYNLGGSLNGIDIAPDDSFLLVAQGTTTAGQATIYRIDLGSGSVTNFNYAGNAAKNVAICSNNRAFFTGSGLHQIDLATNVITVRSVPGPSSPVVLARNASGTRMYLLENPFNNGAFTYDATTDSFGPRAVRYDPVPTRNVAAVNRSGSIVATNSANISLESAPALTFLRAFAGLGIAFDATKDTFYYVTGSAPNQINQIIAVDTNSYRELYHLDTGESLPSFSVPQFGTSNLVASQDGRFLALLTAGGVSLFALPTPPFPAAPLPVFTTSGQMVFDHVGQRLYLTAGAYVWPYNLATQTLEAPYAVGGYVRGIDIAPDDSFVILAQRGYGVAQGAFQKLDLATGAVTNFNYTRSFAEGGSIFVRLAANGRALGTTDQVSPTGGQSFLREANLSTGAVTIRTDVMTLSGGGAVQQDAQIHRSADASRMYLLDGGRQFTYFSATDMFAPFTIATRRANYFDAAMNRNGSLVATRWDSPRLTSLQSTPDFALLADFSALNASIAFDPSSDTLYGTSSYLGQIIAYDTNTLAERFRFDIGENFTYPYSGGQLAVSQDGHSVALITSTGFRVYRVPAVQLVSAVSEKTHLSNSYAVDLRLNGPRAVESRSGGANGSHTIVFTFGQSLATVGAASASAGLIASSMIDPADARRYVVKLTDVADRQTVKVSLSNVVDSAGNRTELISQQFGVLLGDTNGDGAVNSADAQQTRGLSGQSTSAVNFRSDVNADGRIDSDDATVVRAASGMTLP